MTDPIRLLVVGDGVVPTGFSRVIHSILRNLDRDAYDVHHLAINYHGDPHTEDWAIYPAGVGGDALGFNRIPEFLDKIEPQIVLTVGDLWIQRAYLEILRESSLRPAIVTYSPVDSGPVDPEWLEDIDVVSRFVLYSEYGRSEVFAALRHRGRLTALEVIPHGVDTREFRPLPAVGKEAGMTRARRMLGMEPRAAEEAFIVLNANRNQPRKRIDITIQGFTLFAKGKPKGVKLYLHMGPKDDGWDVVKLCRRCGVEDRLILSHSPDGRSPSVTDEQLNIVYNACDVGINTSLGEGWGLVSFEHAATNRAQIVPNHSACRELWRERAHLIPPKYSLVDPKTLTEFQVVTPGDVADALERLYSDTEYRDRVAEACFELSRKSEYNWKKIAQRWHHLFQEVLAA